MTNNGEDSDQDVEDFSDLDVDEVPDDIDDEGPKEVEDVHGPSFCNPSHSIILRNKPGGNMLNVDPDAAHASEFPEYADIVPAHRLASNSQFDELFFGQQFENKADCVFAIKQYNMKLSIDYKVPWRSVYCIRHIAVNFHNEYKNRDWRKRIVNMGYELEPHRFRHKLVRLETDMAGYKPSLTQWLSSIEPWQWAQCFDGGYRYGHMTTNLVEAVNFVLRRTRHLLISAIFSATFYRLATLMPKIGLKQAKQLEAGHVYVEKIRNAMKDNTQRARLMNVELYSRNLETFRVTKYINRQSGIPPRSYGVDLRNRQCECGMFQVLRYPCAHVVAACAIYSLNVKQYIDDVYTLELQSSAFEMLPDRSLCRRVKGRPTITRIRNDMDVREQVNPKRCTICRTVGHNRSKCPHGNVYIGQSSRSKRN
ncbi:hypothetical protein GOBAR_AA32927 [Gossypium barbadense]|uniref:SWIM-type domain-containing protein n=1 Tax=Gossypium barbadense TaxID=3634 RepID=A0A2P5W9J2_GOSBA|nr:hypothetical protein GOBAR_AA32927 [Gossypium barbadense]